MAEHKTEKAARNNADNGDETPRRNLPAVLREYYYGSSPAARRFRYVVLVFDVVVITFFIVTTFTGTSAHYQAVDIAIGVVLAADLITRLAISPRPWAMIARPGFVIDLVVIVALFGSALVPNLDMARVLRMLRVLRSYRLLAELRVDFPWFRKHEEVIESGLNLFVFVFVTTALVFVVEGPANPAVGSFLDALYFTIATLTTTGFGDITAIGPWGRVLAIGIMVFGVGLFLRLIQAVFRPAKFMYECPRCGLERHDIDAVHCKHCGEIINIPSQGAV